MTTAPSRSAASRLPRGSRWLLGLVVPLRVRGDDMEENGLLPKRRLATAILPLVGGGSWATQGGDDLGGSVVCKVGIETHGRRIHGKNKSAMRKIKLVISPQCGHSQRMSNTTLQQLAAEYAQGLRAYYTAKQVDGSQYANHLTDVAVQYGIESWLKEVENYGGGSLEYAADDLQYWQGKWAA